MYRILGNDRKEYGPINAATVRRWIAEGRANGATLLCLDGTEDWKPLRDVPEFQVDLGLRQVAQSFPPPLAPSPASAPAEVQSGGSRPAAKRRREMPRLLGIAALIFGFMALPTRGATAFFALVLAVIALLWGAVRRLGLGQMWPALAGLVMAVAMLIAPPGRNSRRPNNNRPAQMLPACQAGIQQLAQGLRQYANDNSDFFPAATNWCDAVRAQSGSVPGFRCPADRSGSACSYGFNASLAGLDANAVHPETVLLFEMQGGWNASGGAGNVTARHEGRCVVRLVNGRVLALPPAQVAQLRWKP